MTNNELISVLIVEITNQLASYGIKNFEVVRSNQPTNQFAGGTKNARVFLKVISIRSVSNSSFDAGIIKSHLKETRLQISVLSKTNYKSGKELSSLDLCELINDSIFERDSIQSLRNKGIRVERREAINQGFFNNNFDRFEILPSFDLIAVYQNNRIKQTKFIENVNQEIKGMPNDNTNR